MTHSRPPTRFSLSGAVSIISAHRRPARRSRRCGSPESCAWRDAVFRAAPHPAWPSGSHRPAPAWSRSGCCARARTIAAGDARRVALLAVFIQNAFELALRPLIDDVPRAQTAGRVHAHVQRRVVPYTKSRAASSSSCGEETPRSKSIPSILSRFRASRIRAMFSKLSCTSVTLRAWRLSRFLPPASATSSRSTPMSLPVCQAAADLQRVPAAAERSVQIDAVRTDVERVDALPKQYRFMRKLHQKPNSSITCARFSGVRVSISSLSYASLSQISA